MCTESFSRIWLFIFHTSLLQHASHSSYTLQEWTQLMYFLRCIWPWVLIFATYILCYQPHSCRPQRKHFYLFEESLSFSIGFMKGHTAVVLLVQQDPVWQLYSWSWNNSIVPDLMLYTTHFLTECFPVTYEVWHAIWYSWCPYACILLDWEGYTIVSQR